jgi:hypothetical protein
MKADDVPVSPTGTATFDVEVYVGDPVNVGSEMLALAQPAVIAVSSYQDDVSSSDQWAAGAGCGNSAGSTFYRGDVDWTLGIGGRSLGVNQLGSSETALGTNWAAGQNLTWQAKSINGSNWEPFDTDCINSGSDARSYAEKAQTRLVIQPAGQQQIGSTALYLVMAQVINEDTRQQLAASAVSFMNQLAGTTAEDVTTSDGSVWTTAVVSGAAGAQTEVTPQASGNISFNNTQIAKDKNYWQSKVQQDSGVVNYLASRGFMANRQNIQAVYAFYQKLFVQNQNFLWAGLAKLAGAPVYAGLSDAQNLKGDGFYIGGLPMSATAIALGTFGETYGTTFQNDLISMNIAILNDLAWQFEAYKNGGLAAIQTAYAYGNSDLDQPATNAWGEIDQGIQESDSGLVQDGNQKLLQREQQQILASGYLLLSDLPGATTLMTKLAKNPVPNGPDFLTVVPSGNIADYDNRWTWITDSGDGMWPLWVGTDATTQKAWVITSLKNRAVGYSLAQTFSFLSLPIQ